MAGIEYDSDITPNFNFVQTEEGKAVYQSSTGGFEYEYYLGDNLGNTRITFGTKGDSTHVYQKDDYYPFGMEITGTVINPKNEYLYNKKELQEEQQEYDYGARYYDPVICRFTRIDPVAEHFPWLTSYQYASNNPSTKVDLDGLEGIIPEPLFLEEEAIIPKGTSTGSGYSPENIAKAGGDVAKEGSEQPTAKPGQGHHIVPQAHKSNPLVQEARDNGFKFDGQENKIELEKYNKSTGEGEHGNHPNYSNEVGKKLMDLAKDTKNASPAEKVQALRNMVKDLRELINNNRGSKLNDLFKNSNEVKPATQDNTKMVTPLIQPPKTQKQEEAERRLNDPRFT